MKIIDGANPSVVTTLWTGPSAWVQPADHNYTTTFAFAGCQVISLAGRPHILAGTMRVHSNIGARVKAGQQIFVNQGGMNFERRELQYHVPYSSTRRVYMAATRSVKCRNYPSALVREGFNPGALCFFAAYDAHQDHGEVNWGTNTALLKIEMSSTGVVSAMDITASSGLPWVSGAYGTVVGHFNVFNGKSELLNMMDSAFLDFNDDNLPDLITVGQHINPHVSQMIFDRTHPAGIRFGPTTRMLGTSREPMTEYLTVNAFGDVNPNLNMNCLFFTGEQEENTLAPWNVRSHIRCYEGGHWVRYNLPGGPTFGWYNRGLVAADGNGRLILRAKSVHLGVTTTKYYSLDYIGSTKGKIFSHSATQSHFVVAGFACLQNSGTPLTIVATDRPRTQVGAQTLSTVTADRPLGSGPREKCLQTNNSCPRGGFRVQIPLGQISSVGRLYLYALDILGNYAPLGDIATGH